MSDRYRWVVLAAGTLAQASFSALSVGLPALAPALRSHYGLSLGETGIVLGAVGIGMLPTLLPWGLLADRTGERVVIAVGLAGAAAALAATAATHRMWSLVALLALAGALGASVNAASGRAVMGWFGEDERGLALGIRQTAIPIGGAAAAASLPWLATSGGTRLAFLALAGGCLAGAALALAFMRDAPRRELAHAAPERARPPLRDATMWLLGGGSALFLTAQIAITGFAVLFLHEHRGLSTHSAAAVLAGINVLGIGARIGSGRWSDRIHARMRPIREIGIALAIGTALTAAFVDAPLALLIPVLVVSGVLGLSWNGLSFTAAAETAGTARSGAALGLQQTLLGVLVAGVPPAFAAVAASSWRVAFALAAVGPLLGVVALLRVPEPATSRRSARTPGTSATPPAAR
ncbi:MAG: MFS transporter [Actinobacteria bacterium]|nr:MFS transporter [Actinomycetota bacterium]